jgi:RND family efflux transporter MFP subunit
MITQINVQESDNVNPGDELFTVSQTDRLKAKIWVSENDISSIRKGDEAKATWNGDLIEGRVMQVDMSLNSHMQAFGVVVEFDNPSRILPSGVNAEITLISKLDNESIFVERKNILRQKNESIVFVAANGTAQRRIIELGDAVGLAVQVTRGLQEGDLLITEGQMLLNDGDKILVIK